MRLIMSRIFWIYTVCLHVFELSIWYNLNKTFFEICRQTICRLRFGALWIDDSLPGDRWSVLGDHVTSFNRLYSNEFSTKFYNFEDRVLLPLASVDVYSLAINMIRKKKKKNKEKSVKVHGTFCNLNCNKEHDFVFFLYEFICIYEYFIYFL